MPIEFYILSLSALDNKLLLNLYWEMVRYLCFPYLTEDQMAWKLSLEELGIHTNEELIHYLKAEYFKVYNKTVDDLFSFLKTVRPKYAPAKPEPVPFQWSLYRQRPQIRYSLAASIIWSQMIPISRSPEHFMSYGRISSFLLSRQTMRMHEDPNV